MKSHPLFASLLFLASSLPILAQTGGGSDAELLVRQHGAVVRFHRATGVPSFVRFPAGAPLELPGSSPEEKAAAFFETYPALFGIQNLDGELFLKETKTDAAGGRHLVFTQRWQGVPVFGGDLRLHFDQSSRLAAVNGVFVPDLPLNVIPNISAEAAAAVALGKAAADHPDAAVLPVVLKNTLQVFRRGLAQGVLGEAHLVWAVEVGNEADVREHLFVDAHKGGIVEQHPGMCGALFRRLYQTNTGNQVWVEGDPFPGSLDTWQQNELVAAEDTYYFFKNVFGHTSYNNADAEMKTINNASFLGCPNASWNGSTANFCSGTAADDVVGHEWGDAYTEHTNGLIYAWQTGALNESYSDIWGETIDQLNAYGNDAGDTNPRTTCSNSELRWQMGEDATAFPGPIRDLWDPTCDGDPGKVLDTQYACGTGDNGGVHTNSGVPNHAYSLLADGGTYNGQTITGLGLTKAAHIFWETQDLYLTNTSDFSDMADALEAACASLVAVNLPGLTTNSAPAVPSGQIITLADCQEVAEVNTAVQFRTAPACSFSPLLAQNPPSLCDVGTFVTNAFFDNFESGLASWTITQIPSNPPTWDARQWIIDASLPNGRSGSAADEPDPVAGDCNTDLDNGIIRMQSPVVTISASATSPVEMAFDHYVSTEDGWDGGNLKYSLNGGAWTLLPAAAFTYNAYNRNLFTTANGNDNPMQGQAAFSGADGGSVSGTWGQSQINLQAIGLVPGGSIQLRFELGTDGCNGWDSWYVDDARIFTCATALPVELLFFQAKPNGSAIRLDWATAAESGNKAFEVERSADPVGGFEKIGTVAGCGNCPQKTNYHFDDEEAQPGTTWYYRLRQVDFDGAHKFSPVRAAVRPEPQGAGLSLRPNPAKDFATIHFSGEKGEEAQVQVLDAQGRTLLLKTLEASGGFRLDLSGFAPGVYIVKAIAEGQQMVGKLVKE